MGRSKQQSKIIALIFAVGHSSIYHVIFYSESLFLFIYLVCIIKIYEWIVVERKQISEMPIWKLLSITLIFAFNGFVRSTGFLSAAHICYPLLLELISSYTKETRDLKKATKSLFLILLISAIFISPMIHLQYRVYGIYCKGEDAPSFCSNLVPDYYAYIQEKYWRVRLLAFIRLGKYEEGIFIAFSLVVWGRWIARFVMNNPGGILQISLANVPFYLKHKIHSQEVLLLFPVFAIMMIVGGYSFLFANTCSVDRFFSSIPFYYLMVGDLFEAVKDKPILRSVFILIILTRFTFNLSLYSSLIQPA